MNMRITDHIDLFYPDGMAKSYASERRKAIRNSGSMFINDLQLDNLKLLITLVGSEQFMLLAEEFSDDIPTIEYRLDCLENFLNNPELFLSYLSCKSITNCYESKN
ncbi:hypothetical protein SAMN02910406_03828 [Ruminococcus albus]|uniref:Uncharacterized protein n=1 Tax=Ruminococcus albus TaxID=1264 RepID=A0A1I1S9M4_RUMAL|nr:hypothetical protein SAMN02910406_03828 [Ruminococcus albus]